MFKRNILILTKSSKYHNYCVAGIDIHTGKWVRIVSDDEDTAGALTDADCICSDGFPCKILDVVEVTFVEKIPKLYQPENFLMDRDDPWIRRDHLTFHQALEYYRERPEALLFHDRSGRRTLESVIEDYDVHSLEWIRVTNLTFHEVQNRDGQNKIKLEFVYNGVTYQGISMTDPEFYGTEDGKTFEEAYLVVSLGEPYEGYCYKLAAKVFIPKWEEWGESLGIRQTNLNPVSSDPDETASILEEEMWSSFEDELDFSSDSADFSRKHTALRDYFGYDSFRPGQERMIDAILSGKDALGIMPTGAGKSICFQIPAVLMDGITLVISPLISLMKDQVRSLIEAGISAAYINSSLNERQIDKALNNASRGQYKIIYVAPERLETSRFQYFADSVHISQVAVDEAHCVSQWGQDFRPSYLKIADFINSLSPSPVVSAFTATASEEVKNDILSALELKQPEVLITGYDRENLFFSVEHPRRKILYVKEYVSEHAGDSGIIYCATRKNTDEVYETLLEQGIAAGRYHAGMSLEDRRSSQDDFLFDRISVMVATNAFGMGIDKSNVRYVIHYNMPQSMENYYQEAGRAGRDGLPAECILLYGAKDIMVNRFLLEHKEVPEISEEEREEIQRKDNLRLEAMIEYCKTTNCLRQYILQYFGEEGKERCENCSNCNKEFVSQDATREATAVLRCIQEMNERYGITMVTGTLYGGTSEKLRDHHADRYPSYGALHDMGRKNVKEFISQMLRNGALSRTEDEYGILKLNSVSYRILSGLQPFLLRVEKGTDPLSVSKTERETKRTSGKSAKRSTEELDEAGKELFEQLRQLRRDLAEEKKVPPYVIFPDRTLIEMCVKLPTSRMEMLMISGVGHNRLEQYGDAFLKCIQEFVADSKQ